MKFRSIALAVAVVVMGGSAYGKLIPLRPFFFDREISVNGVDIPQGMYTLSLDTQGSSVTVTLLKEGKFVANARGTWVKHGVKYAENAVLLRVNPDGSRSLVEIRLSGLTKSIMLDDVTQMLRVPPGQEHTASNDGRRTPVGN